jgi:succinoglycan biosynthesis protein ExoA
VAAASIAGAVLGVVGAVGWAVDAPQYVKYLVVGFIIPVGYLAGVTGAAVLLARELPPLVRARVPLVLATMHMTWGLGFLTSPRRLARRGAHRA